MITLYPYQKAGVDAIATNYSKGICNQIFQLPTGGGKTITFAAMVQRYMAAFSKNVLILVHRDELLKQTQKTLAKDFRIRSAACTAKNRHKVKAKVHVAMVETAYNRLKRDPNYFGRVGLLIIDECHIGNFKKLYDFFPNVLRVGFSATPISASKKDPLLNQWNEIVTGAQISELIEFGSLTQNETYTLKGVDRSKLKVRNGEFENRSMQSAYSNSKHVKNTVEAYERLGENQKTIIFNCNVEHSKLVNQAFIDAGYPAKHLDGSSKQRKQILHWFKNTPNAILNNIGVLTTGFDEPTVINVIVNKSTLSLPLWLQMTGRGSRVVNESFIARKQKEYNYPLSIKNVFRIIDMGGNAVAHGDWSADRDWHDLFHNPEKPSEGAGVAPIRSCDQCEALIPAQAVICEFCGHVRERIVEYDAIAPEFEKIVGKINVYGLTWDAKKKGHKEFKPFFQILGQIMTTLKYKFSHVELSDDIRERTFLRFQSMIKEWRNITGKKYTKNIAKFTREQYDKKFNELLKKRGLAA